jgi:hypothetical protein
MLNRVTLISVVIAASVGPAGCGGGGSSTTGATPPSTAPAAPYAGTWRGTRTPQTVFAVSFTVAGDRITAFSLQTNLLIFIPPGTFAACSISLTLAEHVTISGSTFTARLQSDYGTTMVRGTFTSNSAANGTFDAWRSASGTCDGASVLAGAETGGDWQATKQ